MVECEGVGGEGRGQAGGGGLQVAGDGVGRAESAAESAVDVVVDDDCLLDQGWEVGFGLDKDVCGGGADVLGGDAVLIGEGLGQEGSYVSAVGVTVFVAGGKSGGVWVEEEAGGWG